MKHVLRAIVFGTLGSTIAITGYAAAVQIDNTGLAIATAAGFLFGVVFSIEP